MFPLPLNVTLEPSRQLRWGLVGLHLLAGAALWLADLPLAGQGAGTGVLALSLVRHLRPQQTLTLRCGRRGELALRQGETWQPLARFEAPLVLPGLALLRYQAGADKGAESRVILPDCLPPEDFRRLRVWLKWLGTGPWHGAAGAAGAYGPTGAGGTPIDTGPPGTR
jgi:hypothetical protein